MKAFVIGLISISFFMALVISFLLSISKGMKSNFSARAKFVVWLLVMIRLALPFGGILLPSLVEISVSEASVQTDTGDNIIEKEETDLNFGGSQTVGTPKQKPHETDPAVNNDTEKAPILSETQQVEVGKDQSVNLKPNNSAPQTEKEMEFELSWDHVFALAFLVWTVGAIIFVAKNLIAYAVFSVKSKKTLSEADGELLLTYNKLCENMGVKGAPKLYVNSVSQSPYCAGYFRKRIVIPNVSLAENEICGILSHELCHHIRKDVWFKLLSVFANAVHWFNPLAYVAAERFDREIEHCCDAAVLKMKTEEEAMEYGKTILNVARECKGGGALTTRFNPRKKAVGERIDNILDAGKKKKRGIIIICAVAVLCIVSGLIIGLRMTEDEKPEKESEETKKEENVSIDDYPVVLWSNEDGVKLCAKNEEDKKGGENVPLVLLFGDDVIYFNGSYIFHVDTRTDYYNTDITGDGVKDHVLILPTASGTGVSEDDLYVFNGKDLAEISVEDPLVFINSQMTFTGDDEYYYVRHYGKEIFKLTKKAFGGIEEEWILEKPLVDSGIKHYYVNENENENGASSIRAEYFVSVAKGNFGSLGDAQVSFSYSGNELKCNEVKFIPYCIAKTNNENWSVWGSGETVSIIGGNGNTVIYLSKDDGLNNFHADNVGSFTATFDKNEKLCLLIYSDVYSENIFGGVVRMMRAALVDLEKGEVIGEFAPSVSELINGHGTAAYDAVKEYAENGEDFIHNLTAVDVTEERAYFYSYFVSDEYRVNLRASVVIWAADKQCTYTAVEPRLPEDSTEIYDVLDELRHIEGVDTCLATAVTAFINKDTLVLENHLGCLCGVLESYKDFEFGSYSFSYSEGVLKLQIEIKKSSLTTVPAGEYTIEFCRGRFAAVTMSGIGAYEYYGNNGEDTDAVTYTRNWLSSFGLYDGSVESYIENINASESDNYKNDVIKYLWWVTGDENSKLNTADEYKKAAKDILGADDFHIPESMIDENGNVQLWGHGGRICMTYVFPEEREGNTVTVKVQSYADFSKTVESHVYEFKYEDCGDYLRFVSVDIIEEGKYEPEDRYMA